MTSRVEHERDLVAERLDAQIDEAEARLKVMGARAEARQAAADVKRISGLTAAGEQMKKDLAEMKRQAAGDSEAAKEAVEQKVARFRNDVQRIGERYKALDEAAARQFYARLDEAEAQLKVWKAQADQERAEQRMKRHDELAAFEAELGLARARAAEASHAKHSAKAQAALEKAARHFDQAYAAAAKRYEQD